MRLPAIAKEGTTERSKDAIHARLPVYDGARVPFCPRLRVIRDALAQFLSVAVVRFKGLILFDLNNEEAGKLWVGEGEVAFSQVMAVAFHKVIVCNEDGVFGEESLSIGYEFQLRFVKYRHVGGNGFGLLCWLRG